MPEKSENVFSKLFPRGSGQDGERKDIRRDIRTLVTRGKAQLQLPEKEADMILAILGFADTKAQDIMTHKQGMVWIDDDMTLDAAIAEMLGSGFSRFPVRHKDDADDVTDAVYFKDAVKYKERHPQDAGSPIGSLHGLFRRSLIVTETMDIDDLLREMQDTKIQMAVCIGEYGQTVGLVSMEDILEEIVGDIHDEYDEEDRYIWPTGRKNEYVLDGGAPLDELTDFFKTDFRDDRVETLNGYMITRMDRLPENSDEDFKVTLKGRENDFELSILSAKDHKIERVLAKRLEKPQNRA